MEELAYKSTVDCAKQCVISPATERVIGQIYALLQKRDMSALKYSQAVRLMDKNNLVIEISSINEQIKNLLILY